MTSTSIPPSLSAKQVCNQCQATFICGAEAGHETCWCMALPHLPTGHTDLSAGCLCPECLKAKITSLMPNNRI